MIMSDNALKIGQIHICSLKTIPNNTSNLMYFLIISSIREKVIWFPLTADCVVINFFWIQIYQILFPISSPKFPNIIYVMFELRQVDGVDEPARFVFVMLAAKKRYQKFHQMDSHKKCNERFKQLQTLQTSYLLIKKPLDHLFVDSGWFVAFVVPNVGIVNSS